MHRCTDMHMDMACIPSLHSYGYGGYARNPSSSVLLLLSPSTPRCQSQSQSPTSRIWPSAHVYCSQRSKRYLLSTRARASDDDGAGDDGETLPSSPVLPSSSSSSSSGVANDSDGLIHRNNEEMSFLETSSGRLFSTLNEASLKHEPGNLRNAVLLIAGTTVGAGILAIPAVTQEAGFLASTFTCIACWLYMVTTGLLIAEVNLSTMYDLGSGGISLVSMTQRTLGKGGVLIACLSYLFIHYALLVAYVARSSDILTNTLGTPEWLSAGVFSFVIGGICYSGSQRVIGAFNGFLVAGTIGSFTALVFAAASDLHWNVLLKANFAAIPPSIPIIALSFVYHNVVPVVCTDLEGDIKKIRSAVIWGTSIPLVMFIIWDAVILGSLSGLTQGEDPLAQLRTANGVIGPTIEVFSLLAISTSYIGFVLGLADFLSDLLRLPADRGKNPLSYLLSIIPPLLLALLDPDIFFKALDFAGTYGVLMLFGILPASMAWNERYKNADRPSKNPVLMVPGGRIVLGLVIGGASYVIISELMDSLSKVVY